MNRVAILAAVVVLVGMAGILGLRTMSSVTADDVGPRSVSVECSGWTGIGDGCAAWGEEVLAEGSPSTTFEIDDVVRLRLDKPALGFAGTCIAEYFLGRYPDEVAWSEEVPCAHG